MLSTLLFGVTFLLAYSNGANDNFKGVASLYASGTTGYKRALAWGTVTTFLGSVASILLAQGLLTAFSGKGLVPPSVADSSAFLLSVATGAGGTIILATLLGFPISTTHSLVGGIVGAGFLAAGGELKASALVSTFLVPLVASPGIALLFAAGLYWSLHLGRRMVGLEKIECICVARTSVSIGALGAAAAMGINDSSYHVSVGSEEQCCDAYSGTVGGVRWQSLVDGAHFLSAGIVSFARGLNDTPKIAALLLVVRFLNVPASLIIVGAGMAAGGLLSARRVATTMGERITKMNHGQGLAANIATGVLVIWASRLGVPVSTTHVSVGALFGIGVTTGQADLAVMRNIVLSWLVTLPCAAALAAGVYWVVTVP